MKSSYLKQQHLNQNHLEHSHVKHSHVKHNHLKHSHLKPLQYAVVFLILFFSSVSLAGSVTGASIWLTRIDNRLGLVEYAFFTDIYGTIDEFQSVVLRTPLGDSHELSLSVEGDQWGSDTLGQEEMLDLFTTGTYTFEVTYTDSTTESVERHLLGIFPEPVQNVQIEGQLLTWKMWDEPLASGHIELDVITSCGHLEVELDTSATSAVIPPGANINLLELSFRQNESADAFMSSTYLIEKSPRNQRDCLARH